MQKQQGLSLLEVILAVAIIGVIALIVISLPSSFLLNSSSQHQDIAKQILSQQVDNLRLQGYQNLSNGNQAISDSRLSQLPFQTSQVITSDCPQSICPNSESTKLVRFIITWKEGASLKSAEIDTLISQGGLN